MKDKRRPKKEAFVDDGRTIVEMNVDGMPWYDGKGPHEKKKKDNDKPTRRETARLIFGMYRALLPFLLIAIACFALVFVFLYLALKSSV